MVLGRLCDDLFTELGGGIFLCGQENCENSLLNCSLSISAFYGLVSFVIPFANKIESIQASR